MPYPRSKSAFRYWSAELSAVGNFCSGLRLSLADFFMLPIIHGFWLSRPRGRAMYPKFPAICAWRERMESLPTMKRFRAAQPPARTDRTCAAMGGVAPPEILKRETVSLVFLRWLTDQADRSNQFCNHPY